MVSLAFEPRLAPLPPLSEPDIGPQELTRLWSRQFYASDRNPAKQNQPTPSGQNGTHAAVGLDGRYTQHNGQPVFQPIPSGGDQKRSDEWNHFRSGINSAVDRPCEVLHRRSASEIELPPPGCCALFFQKRKLRRW